MSKKGVSTMKVAATYIGTVVGAGFATGQEILQFFTRFGTLGLVGLIVTTLMFIVFGYIIMDLGRHINARSHLDIIKATNSGIIQTLLDSIITLFLFSSFTAMIAGTGALFSQQFNFPGLYGNIFMAILTALTVLTGINGVINSISFVVPFLLCAVIGTSIFSVSNYQLDFGSTPVILNENILISNWFLSSVLYVSYNLIISIGILGPLGNEAKDMNAVKKGAVLGGLGLGVGSIMIYLALSGSILEISNLEVPMIYIAGRISYPIQIIYSAVLVAEIYTTAVGSLYGFISRITDIRKFSFKNSMIVVEITIAALLAGQFGFSNLVKYLYPIEGYCGIILLVSLIYTKFFHQFLKRNTIKF